MSSGAETSCHHPVISIGKQLLWKQHSQSWLVTLLGIHNSRCLGLMLQRAARNGRNKKRQHDRCDWHFLVAFLLMYWRKSSPVIDGKVNPYSFNGDDYFSIYDWGWLYPSIWWFPEIGLPPVIIHFKMGFSLTKTNQLLGYPHFRIPPYLVPGENRILLTSFGGALKLCPVSTRRITDQRVTHVHILCGSQIPLANLNLCYFWRWVYHQFYQLFLKSVFQSSTHHRPIRNSPFKRAASGTAKSPRLERDRGKLTGYRSSD